MAFCPFLGGKRVCFGKTFADINMKIVAVYMTQLFDMKFVDQESYPDTHSLPLTQMGQSEKIKLLVTLTQHYRLSQATLSE